MPNDPGLLNDTCTFVEAIAGDGGAHDASQVWWLSPDVGLTGPVSGPDRADPGQVNTGTVTFRRKPAASGCLFPNDESLTVELWVAGPSLVMLPHVHGSAARIGFIGSPVPAEGGTGTQSIDWTPTPGLAPNAPLSAGPKCLVARAYPSSGAASATSFFVPGDPHVAQHNFVTLPFTQAAMLPPGVGALTVATLNPAPPLNPLQKAQVKLRAVLDLAPHGFVRQLVLDRLALVPGFQHLRASPLRGGFRFDLSAFATSNVVDHSQIVPPFPPGQLPSFEATIELAGGHVVPVPFLAHIGAAQVGEACVFHLIQRSTANVVEGGLTVVMVRL
jgi:hypothetical protein